MEKPILWNSLLHQTIYGSHLVGKNSCRPNEISAPAPRRNRVRNGTISGMDKLPLPDLYLIDSRKLLAEVDRIRSLALSIPLSERTHAATQSVVDALWHLRRDMEEILKVEAAIHSSFVQKAEALAEANQPPRIGLKVIEGGITA